jgi:hypothetical protein
MKAYGDIIPVGADDGLTGGGLALAGLEDGILHAGAGGGEIGECECFVFSGNVLLGGGNERGEIRDEAGAAFGEKGAVLDEDVLVGDEFGEAEAGFLEEEVLGAEGALVAGVGGAVSGVELPSKEIEKMPPCLAGAADQREILITHPDDKAAIREVSGAGGARLAIREEAQAAGGVLDFPLLPPRIRGDAEAGGGDFGEGVETGTARRLQADEDADRLQDGGFAAGVVTNENQAFLWCIEFKGGKAAEVLEAEVLEH